MPSIEIKALYLNCKFGDVVTGAGLKWVGDGTCRRVYGVGTLGSNLMAATRRYDRPKKSIGFLIYGT